MQTETQPAVQECNFKYLSRCWSVFRCCGCCPQEVSSLLLLFSLPPVRKRSSECLSAESTPTSTFSSKIPLVFFSSFLLSDDFAFPLTHSESVWGSFPVCSIQSGDVVCRSRRGPAACAFKNLPVWADLQADMMAAWHLGEAAAARFTGAHRHMSCSPVFSGTVWTFLQLFCGNKTRWFWGKN